MYKLPLFRYTDSVHFEANNVEFLTIFTQIENRWLAAGVRSTATFNILGSLLTRCLQRRPDCC